MIPFTKVCQATSRLFNGMKMPFFCQRALSHWLTTLVAQIKPFAMNSTLMGQYHVELTEDMLDTWLHDPSLKKEFIDTYGIDEFQRVEREAIELFPTYAQHSSIMLKNFFRISELI